jgi:recombinational DNA repair ATPase RecF
MIQLEDLVIENFRGIRNLPIPFNRKSFGIYGPNGTGKSGVVDAIEFVLTGNVTRLTGKGTGGLSVKQHGPHVDFRSQTDKAVVRAKVFAPILNKSFTIERRVNQAGKPAIEPADDAEINALVRELSIHPEFALSRREILKYVLAEPGKRNEEVQALLKLDDVEKIRTALKKIVNECTKANEHAKNQLDQTRGQLVSALKIPQLTVPAMLQSVNERRNILGLESLAEIGKDTSLKAGIVGAGANQKSALVKKGAATADLAAVETRSGAQDSQAVTESRTATVAILTQLKKDPALLSNFRRRDFLTRALELVDGPACPVCDHPWEVEALRQLVQGKLKAAAEASALKTKLATVSQDLRQEISELVGLIGVVEGHALILKQAECAEELRAWKEALVGLRAASTTGDALDATIGALESEWRRAPAKLIPYIDTLRTAIAALPDPSVEDAAREFLIMSQERLEVYQNARRQFERQKNRVDVAEKVSQAFEDSSKGVLTALYREVEKDFTKYYSFVHREDEAEFSGTLTPSLGKLGFEVNFYGKGMFPPGAYHSEGHQDSMGLCLYLALMKRILGKDFRLAVLDDVLMSVDAGHRKEVCRLLRQEFADTQFIFTTHDQVWLNHMIGEGLTTSKTVIEFRRWSVEDGPHNWDFSDVWSDIDDCLNDNDVPGAAHTLRRYLEKTSADLCSRLRVMVEFRSSQAYDLGDFLPPLIGRFGELLKRAKEAAQSWGQTDTFNRLKELHGKFSERWRLTDDEKWIINPGVHYNEWATLSREDFRPVAEAFKMLIEMFSCPECNLQLYVDPPKGQMGSVRCECGQTNFNLKKKAAATQK